MWSTEKIELAIHVAGLASWILSLMLLLLVPGLLGLIATSYTHSRTERLSTYIDKFVPYPIFTASVYLINLLSLISIALQLGLRLGRLSDDRLPDLLRMGGWIVLGILALGFFGRLTYRLWGYLYMPREAVQWLRQDYFVLATLRSVVLIVLQLLLLTPIGTSVYLWIFVSVILLIQSLRWLQTFRRLWGCGSYFYIFLYLCAHELLPWLCIAQLVRYYVLS